MNKSIFSLLQKTGISVGLAMLAAGWARPTYGGSAQDRPSVSGRGSTEIPPAIDAIREEAVRKAVSDEGFPLPLTTAWNDGMYHYTGSNRPRGADPAWQLEQIEKGWRYLPVLVMPEADFDEAKFGDYLYPPFEKLRNYRLPFTLKSPQWERHLTNDPEYFNLPLDRNPNVVTPGGETLKRVDPFGPTELWYEVGKKLTDHPVMARLQQIYPDPPRIIFLSNNEHAKLRWSDAEKSRRYLEKYGTGKSDQFKRKVVGDAWIEKYRALQQGMRDGLINENWKKNAIFIGYGGDVGMDAMGRWGGWTAYSLHTPGRFSLAPLMWDGVSPSYYMHNWSSVSDYRVQSNQIEAMNNVFVLKQAYEINPGFWYELSVWDGDQANKKTGAKPKLTVYREAGQTYDMERYRGWLQYGLWLLRPRALRLYEGWSAPVERLQGKLEQIRLITDRVHENATLRAYWRKGELVPNDKDQHPYQSNLPNEVLAQERWFLLDADVNPERPWKLDREIPVFSLALRLGKVPKRSWLVYAHAPLREYRDVEIRIPQWQSIKVDVPREGAFYEIREADGSVMKINDQKSQSIE